MFDSYGDLLDVYEAASELHKSAWSIRDLCRKGELPSVKVGGRILIPKRELIEHLKARMTAGVER